MDTLLLALEMTFKTGNLFFIILGTLVGMVFGAFPGLGGVVALTLLLPFTFGMEPMSAMFLYSGCMGAIPFGGSISAILINTPGTTANIATCFDGYPMTQKGEAGRALGISATASGLGAVFGVFILILLLPVVRAVILAFGPTEFFMMIMFGLATIVIASRGNLFKGLTSGGVGILLSLIGRSKVSGELRYTFDTFYLWDGLVLVAFMVGLFGLSEMFSIAMSGRSTIAAKASREKVRGVFQGVKDVFAHKMCFFRSSAIGTLIGIIPGVGGTAANFISYTTAMQLSKNPENFGKGEPEGIIAPESANNSKDGGSLLPTVAFGIPGSAEMAVLLGAFVLHGLTPGPLLLRDHLDLVWALIIGLVLSNLMASTFGLLAANFLARLTLINISYIVPLVGVICLIGSYSMRGNIIDVLVTIIAGFLGVGLRTYGFPVITLGIGFVLGNLAERSFLQALMVSHGSYLIFFKRPISLVLFILLLLLLALPFIRRNK